MVAHLLREAAHELTLAAPLLDCLTCLLQTREHTHKAREATQCAHKPSYASELGARNLYCKLMTGAGADAGGPVAEKPCTQNDEYCIRLGPPAE